jgi:hypothetical protein
MRNGSGIATQGVKIHVVKRDGEEASNHLLLLAKVMTFDLEMLTTEKPASSIFPISIERNILYEL